MTQKEIRCEHQYIITQDKHPMVARRCKLSESRKQSQIIKITV